MSLIKNAMMTAMAFLTAVTISAAQDGAALSFTRIVRDPVSVGMGFSGIASVHGVEYSSFRNSSVIPFASERLSIGASGQIWAPDGVKSSNIAFGSAFRTGERFGFSIGGAYQLGEEYMSTDETGNAAGTFTPNDLIVNAGAGFKIMESLAVGVNVRYAWQKLSYDNSYSAISTDVFLSYRISGMNITAGVSSVGSSVKSVSGDSFSLPTSACAGAEWSKHFPSNHGLRLLADADYYFSGNVTVAAGAEYSFKDSVFLRGGYHYGAKDNGLPSFASAGLGLKVKGLKFDAAYILASEALSGTLTLGLGYSF